MYARKIFLRLALSFLFLFGCAVLQPPASPTFNTPPPTAPRVAVENLGPPIVNPENAPITLKDPVIEDMLTQVSQQDLVSYVGTLAGFGTRHSFSETQLGDYGIGAARAFIFNEFNRFNREGAGRLQVEYEDFSPTINGVTTVQQNVVVTLPGVSNHAGIIMMIAHYDSRSVDPFDGRSLAPGADDNATGVAAMLEIARLMSGRQWNQTIMFVAFAAEEQRMRGSNYFVTNRWLEGAQFDAVLNNDVVGGRAGIPRSIRVFASPEDMSNSRQLARYIEYIGNVYTPNFTIDLQGNVDRSDEVFGQRYSDHVQFINVGAAAVRMTESVEDPTVQHTSRDTADLIDYSYLRQVTQLNLAAVANLAGGLPPPESPLASPMADAGSYLLNWTPKPGEVGYAISFREVGAGLYPPFRIVSRQNAGNVALTDFDPDKTFAVSMAAIDINGRIGLFSPETLVGP